MSPHTFTDQVHHGLGYQGYEELDGLRISTLVQGLPSPKHLQCALRRGFERKETDALKFGTAWHAILLEPDKFRSTYQRSSPCETLMKSGARKGEPCGCNAKGRNADGFWACGKHGAEEDASVLSPAQFDTLESMRQEVMKHPVIDLLRQKGGTETAVVGEMMGHQCKGLIDKLVPKRGNMQNAWVLDLKKTRAGCITEDKWRREIDNYHYDVKASWYRDLAEKATGEPHGFIWLCQEDVPPYDIGVWQQDDESYQIGCSEYLALLSQITACRKTGDWPGVSQQILPISVAGWKRKKFEHILPKD